MEDNTRAKLEAAIESAKRDLDRLHDVCRWLKDHNLNHEFRYRSVIAEMLGDAIYHFEKCLSDEHSAEDILHSKVTISF